MKKFVFSLEQVLKQKIAREEDALMEQAKAQQEFYRGQSDLEISQKKLESAFNYAEQTLTAEEQMQALLYRESLHSTIVRQTRLLQRSEEVLNARIKDTLKARQERMVLEKLKGKRLQEYKDMEAYLEQKEIDELAILGFGRHNS